MPDSKGAVKANDKTREMLDDLIERTYEKFFKIEEIEKIKIGEFLKMIEQRLKLTPDDLSQKQFWTKLEEIRKEALSGAASSRRTAPAKKKTSNRKKAKTSRKSK